MICMGETPESLAAPVFFSQRSTRVYNLSATLYVTTVFGLAMCLPSDLGRDNSFLPSSVAQNRKYSALSSTRETSAKVYLGRPRGRQ